MTGSRKALNIALQHGERMNPPRRNVVIAALTAAAGGFASRGLGIIMSVVVARTLQPTEVGLLGLAVIVTGVLSLVAACAETAGVVGSSRYTAVAHASAALIIRAALTVPL